jgi:hypothetical protein
MKDQQESDLPDGLSQPALRALHGAGVTDLEQLTAFKEADILNLHGMGPKGIRLLKAALDARSLSFASGSPSGSSRTKGS